MKKKLSFKQWAGAILVLLLFILLTLFLYGYFHEDSRFEKFAMQFFVNELSSNPINLHYTLTDPSVYGIDESSMTLPIYHAGQALENWDSIQETLSRLKKFHPERLSSSNQYTYILFTTYLETGKPAQLILIMKNRFLPFPAYSPICPYCWRITGLLLRQTFRIISLSFPRFLLIWREFSYMNGKRSNMTFLCRIRP